jgi:ABC-type dipeptide/oligopeptide/nickel transport system permease component
MILHLAPGDPADILLGQGATAESIRALRSELGLDQPLVVQLGKFLRRLLQGDLGTSLTFKRPALSLILQALPNTAALAVAAFAISVLCAVPVGVVSASRRGTMVDRVALSGLLVTQSLPTFWIGIILIYVFAVALGWLPTSGSGTWRHLLLPAVTLSTYQLALLARAVRSGMLEVLSEDYIRTAHAKGLSAWQVLTRHAFRNTLIPVVTILTLQLGAVLGGSFITEAVFAWPGIGTLALGAIASRDYPLVLAIVLFSSAMIVALNLLADMIYPLIDPRVRQA